jgi:DNA polymerase-1
VKLKLEQMIKELGMEFLFRSIDMAILPEVHEMMQNGMTVDIPYLKDLSKHYSEGMDEAASRAASKIGHPFNPSSSKQVATVIYDELKFKPTKKTKTGLICTDDRELKKVQHPVIKDILDFRRLNKNKGTFSDSLAENAICHKFHGQDVYRVHTTLKTTRTDTGRLSSSDPINLQTMPTRTDEGKKIRMAFEFSPGYRGLAGDFIQQEMKVQAHLAQCKTMIDMFRRGADFHTETAAHIFGVSMEEAKQTKYRYPSKSTNFGVIYLISAQGLLEKIHEDAADIIVDGKPMDVSEWTLESCEKLIADWYKMYPEVRDYQMERIAFARRHGYVEDMFGRRRYAAAVTCPISDIREGEERAVVNMPIQSSSQGVTKLAMAALWRSWRAMGSPDDIRFLVQIHDEVMLEVRDDDEYVMQCARWLKGTMDNVVMLSIPMISDVKAGKRWGDMKKLELEETVR